MTRPQPRTPTVADRVLAGLSSTGLVGSSLTGLADGPVEVAGGLLVLSLVTGAWAAGRWYDRQPDGRRGE